MRCLFDTDVLLDVVLAREPFVHASAHALLLAEQHAFEAVTTPLVLAHLFYLVGRARSRDAAFDAISAIRLILDIVAISRTETDAALARRADYPDWEDQLQYAAAEHHGCDLLVTRNVRDFPAAPVHAVTPQELIASALEPGGF